MSGKSRSLALPEWAAVANRVIACFSLAATARQIPYSEDLAGACLTVTVALHAALASVGVNASFVGGALLRPRRIEPHAWLEVGSLFLDGTASQAGLVVGARIVPSTSQAYRAHPGRWPWLCTTGPAFHAGEPGVAPGPWGLEHEIIEVLSRALARPASECAYHVARSLWGGDSGRDGCGHPLALSSAALVHGADLAHDDLRALASITRRLAQGEAVHGWTEVRRGVLGRTAGDGVVSPATNSRETAPEKDEKGAPS